jgi:hypothetical protein
LGHCKYQMVGAISEAANSAAEVSASGKDACRPSESLIYQYPW